ncbi:MAG TPA: sulfite exporter TauE/SafE family protein [Kofleriaceae bacterium]|jgi:hypothetical protein|nr:sulfite exporter TauE/SafE family protein [Kofleriaceae bacterium]
MLSTFQLVVVATVCVVASALGAITGSTSLVTVPTMLLVGMSPTTAIATNMLGLFCLSLGATVPFARTKRLHAHPTIGLALGAIPGSVVGALVAVAISATMLRSLIAVAMLVMAVIVIATPQLGQQPHERGAAARWAGYVTMALWAIYGGLFSGGYATVATIACVGFFGLTFVDAVGVTKVVNAASSLAAVVVFALEDRIDSRVGAAVSIASLVGGWLGARFAIERGTTWVRRLFVVTVIALAVRLIEQSVFS